MAKPKLHILILILLFGTVTVAQDGRVLINRIQLETQEREPEWKLESKSANEMGVMMRWRHGDEQVFTIIHITDSTKLARKYYRDGVTKSGGRLGTITKLKDWGDESYFVRDYLKQGNMALIVRKGKTIIQTVGNSEDAIKRFSQHILNQIVAI